MFDRPIAPVLPPPPADRPTTRPYPGFVPRPPLAHLLTQPTTTTWTYALSKVDPSGRVSDRSVMTTLGWEPGDPVTVTADGTRVIAFSRDDRGHQAVIRNGRIRIPASLRRRCGIHPRDRVLLAANHDLDVLVVYTQPGLEQALLAMHKTNEEAVR